MFVQIQNNILIYLIHLNNNQLIIPQNIKTQYIYVIKINNGIQDVHKKHFNNENKFQVKFFKFKLQNKNYHYNQIMKKNNL